MPTTAIRNLAGAVEEFTDSMLTGALVPDRASSAGAQTPPAGYLYYAVLALGSDAEFGASTKFHDMPGDGPADGDPIPAGVVIPIGAHEVVDLDVVGTVVYLYLMPKP